MIKPDEVEVGSIVKASNSFGLVYTVDAIVNGKYTLVHNTGELVMKGGKMVDETFTYEDIALSEITEVFGK